MFRTVTGGSTGGNLFNLNWAEFGGNGITVQKVTAQQTAGASVPATLALSLGTTATFGAFTPGVAKTYTAATSANVISTAGDATLSISDPSSTATGRLVNGTFSLVQPRAGEGGERGRHRRRVRARRRLGQPDVAAHLRRARVQ